MCVVQELPYGDRNPMHANYKERLYVVDAIMPRVLALLSSLASWFIIQIPRPGTSLLGRSMICLERPLQTVDGYRYLHLNERSVKKYRVKVDD